MMIENDIKTDLRDLVYVEEEVYALLKSIQSTSKTKKQILDNILEKQTIVTKLIHFFDTKSL